MIAPSMKKLIFVKIASKKGSTTVIDSVFTPTMPTTASLFAAVETVIS